MANAEEKPRQKLIAGMGAILSTWRHRIDVPEDYSLLGFPRVRDRTDVLFEQHGARDTDFRRGRPLGKRDHLVCWSKPKMKPEWMSQEEYRRPRR